MTHPTPTPVTWPGGLQKLAVVVAVAVLAAVPVTWLVLGLGG